MKTVFTASQFIPTQWHTAEDKANFANQFVRFYESGFKRTLFPKWFYTRLSMCFHHIAHFNIDGFYHTWFSDQHTIENFKFRIKNYIVCGDPTYTYSDVERVLVAWVKSK